MFFCVIALLCTTLHGYAQKTDIKFTRLSVNEGLSHLVTNFVNQDKEGFIWVGTDDGLNKFDGYRFKIYRNIPDNANSLSDNIVTCYLEDEEGFIWLGTHDGLNRIDPETDEITRFFSNRKDSTSLSNNLMRSIAQDEQGFIWVGTENGLNKFNPQSKINKRYYQTDSIQGFLGNVIHKIYIDRENQLWFKTELGVYRMNLRTERIETIIKLGQPEKSFIVNSNFGMWQDRSGNMLIGSGTGLYVFDATTEEIKNYVHDPSDPTSISNNVVTSIYQDSQGTIWVGTNDGLNRFDKERGRFQAYKPNLTNPKSLSSNRIRSIFQDKSGAIWIGNFSSGVDRFNPFSKNFNYFKNLDENITDASSRFVWALLEDRNKNVWWGTDHGLYVINEETSEVKFFGVAEEAEKGIVQEFVGALYQDSQGNIWIGTDVGVSVLRAEYANRIFDPGIRVEFEHIDTKERILTFRENRRDKKMWVGVFDNGLLSYDMGAVEDPEKRTPEFILAGNPEYEIDKINVAYIHLDGTIVWIGTQEGLIKMDLRTKGIKRFKYQQGNLNSVSHNKVYCIHPGEDNILWLATYGGGINKFDTVKETFKYYTTKDGLLNNVVYSVLRDEEGMVWISSNNGLSKFNPKTETFRNYGEDDGVQSHEFNQGAFYLGATGRMYFGGNNGFNAFFPDNIIDDQTVPRITLTEFSIFNKPVLPGQSLKELGIGKDSKVLLDKNINVAESIKLSHEYSVFSIEFSTSHYLNPKRNSFEYMLEGFDNDWIAVNSDNRKITYTNLDPGKYIFKVKAANKDGVWNDSPKSLKIVISPPFYRTVWFYILCVMVFVTMLYVIFKIRLNRIKLQHFRSQDELKTAMLREIHHRIKNNLHVVKSLLSMQATSIKDKKIVAQFKKAQSRVISMAILHEKMYKSESLKEIDVQEHFELLVRELVDAYEIDKDISIQFNIENVKLNMETLVPLGLIINELISNSLKYAFVEKRVGVLTVSLKETGVKNQFELVVGDDGIGIVRNDKSDQMGSSLVKTFVKQLNGFIELLDRPGTHFRIIFQKITQR